MGQAKKIPWYSHRLTHRKRVTSELQGSYFRLITIKHAISKIEWAIKRALNYYIAQSRRKSRQLSRVQGSCSRVGDGDKRDVVGKATPCLRGPREPWLNWGLEKMLIRCSKESQHPAEWARTSGWASREQERHNVDGHQFGGQNISFLFSLQLPLTPQTLSNPFRTLAIKWEVNILLKKSSCVFIIASVLIIVPLWCCRWAYNTTC